MALAFTKPVTSIADTTTGPTYSFASFTPTAGAGIVVGVYISATGTPAKPSLDVPTWLDGAWAEETDEAGTANRLTVWSGKVSGSPSADTLSVTGTSPLGCIAFLVHITGQDPTDFVLQPEDGNLGSVTSTTQTLAGALSNADSAHLMFLGHNTNEVQNPNGGETEFDDQGHNSPTRRMSAQYQVNDNASSMTWATATQALYSLMEIKAAAGTGHTANPSSTVALTDAVAKARGLAAADTLSLADARAHARGLGRADTLALADAFARATATARSVPDTVALSDSLATAKVIPLAINDTLSLADNAAPVKLKAVAVDDSVTLTDAQAKARGLAVTDTLALTDSAARAKVIPKAVDDTLTLTDARAHARGLAPADTLALTDSASTNLFVGGTDHTRQIDDTVALSDARAFSRGLTRTEALSLTDNFTRLAAYQRTPTDTLTLADLLSRTHTASRTFTDAVTLSDLLSPEVPGEVDIDDTVLLTDELTHMLRREPIAAGHIEYALTGSVPENGMGRITGGDTARITEAEGGMVAR